MLLSGTEGDQTLTLPVAPFFKEWGKFIYNRCQGGRTWQPFVGGKSGHENSCQTRTYNFRDKCVVFVGNRKFANLTQLNMQYIPCNSALLAQETLFLTKRGTFFAQRSPKSA